MLQNSGNAVCRAIAFLLSVAALWGCVDRQSDLKKAEKDLQQQLSQTRARQSQELATLRERELPMLRGELEKALRSARDLQARHEEDRVQKLSGLDKTGISERFDSLDLIIGKILLRLDDIEKRLQNHERR